MVALRRKLLICICWSPACINMKPVINNEESYQGDPESKSTYNDVETLVLSKTEGSAALFCRRLKYRVKTDETSDQSSPDTDTEDELPISTSPTPGKKFVCKLCGFEFTYNSNMVRHMRIHTEETPYVCEICGKGFKRQDWLKLHISVHTGVKRKRKKKFSCDQCEKKFHGSTALRSHLNKHKGERPFPCVQCDKSFFSHSDLYRHINDCHSEKKHSCSLCGNGFTRRTSLLKHMRIHTGERPYSCPHCGKTFPYKYSFEMHLKRHSA
ncbi:uncharacterized protein LOC100002333 isoform 2 [Danio rerio]|uniref:Si:dkeyp-2e4.3 n=1 Tax=Danio rerio TaxID=7955 RepID=A2CEY2_DANRE|nr:uncharacterized protein LOC100002333 isoform 2 [Danio rerio]|eukprot:NP_001121755.1 uncharacterized protein LOC100002333 isoform 2 [Danio rerio]